MSIIGKIVTLFSDKAKSEPIFPRTKTKAVTNDEGKNLDIINSEFSSALTAVQTTANNALPKTGTAANSSKLNNKTEGSLSVNYAASAGSAANSDKVDGFDVTFSGDVTNNSQWVLAYDKSDPWHKVGPAEISRLSTRSNNISMSLSGSTLYITFS